MTILGTLILNIVCLYIDSEYCLCTVQRKNIARLVRRCELRVELMAFKGWLDELAYLRTTYGRAQARPAYVHACMQRTWMHRNFFIGVEALPIFI